VSFNAHTLEYEVVAKSTEAFDAGYLSEPELIQFPTENGNVAFGFFYAPKNKDYEPTKGEKPPLIVKIHGGPTYAARTLFNKEVQFWTSHGFAVFDVNYGGSTGYGRAFRKRLNGNWGIVDIDDAVNGSKFLAEQGKVDGEKMVITGESAGGYTTLTSLAFRDVFAAGASYYGISDLSALVGETHKFESRYLDRLVGPYPKMKSVYDERSAMSHVDGINVPLIIFQGMKDPIVPPNQAEKIRDAVKAHGQPVEFYTYEDESHGFVKASTIQHSRTKELEFYRRVLR
jgi:dipeptidyl aminopeptidase/acylaminoacyl peptidase